MLSNIAVTIFVQFTSWGHWKRKIHNQSLQFNFFSFLNNCPLRSVQGHVLARICEYVACDILWMGRQTYDCLVTYLSGHGTASNLDVYSIQKTALAEIVTEIVNLNRQPLLPENLNVCFHPYFCYLLFTRFFRIITWFLKREKDPLVPT